MNNINSTPSTQDIDAMFQWLENMHPSFRTEFTSLQVKRLVDCFQDNKKKKSFENSAKKWVVGGEPIQDFHRKIVSKLVNLNRDTQTDIPNTPKTITSTEKSTHKNEKEAFQDLILEKKKEILQKIQQKEINKINSENNNKNKVLVSIYMDIELAYIINQIYITHGTTAFSKSNIYNLAIEEFLGTRIIHAIPKDIELGGK